MPSCASNLGKFHYFNIFYCDLDIENYQNLNEYIERIYCPLLSLARIGGAELTSRHQILVSKNVHSKILRKTKNWEVSPQPTVAIQAMQIWL